MATIALLVFGSLFDEHYWLPTTFTSLRFYWLTPIWLLSALALVNRRHRLAASTLPSLLWWLWSFGPLWLPGPPVSDAEGPGFTVASYNTLVTNPNSESVIQSLIDADADLIGLQELSPRMAVDLEQAMAADYPYRVLDVENAALSRYPMRRVASTLPGTWGELSHPQVYRVEVEGRTLTWINAHQFAPITLGSGHATRRLLAERRRQSQSIADLAIDEIQRHGRSVLLTTDLNATDQNGVHALLGEILHDAWRDAGFGLGSTWRYQGRFGLFPGGLWLARIDFVFHSTDLRAASARLGRWDGDSDHRPVIADLRFGSE